MGGFGSTRWNWHNKKTTVEDCRKITIYSLKPWLRAGAWGDSTWTRGGRQVAAISWQITGGDHPEAIRFIYTHTNRDGAKTDLDYPIPLTFTLTPWGARRYWFTCPDCGRRSGALYLAPGRRRFSCRLCCKLTYTSSQESGKWDKFYFDFAMSMQDLQPGITGADIRYLLNNPYGPPPPGGYYDRLIAERINELRSYDPYADYLTAAELCEQSGLTLNSLAALESARLLLPDHDGRYRPKLAGWGRKLARLLAEGWNLDELKAWARGRWSTPDPRRFPPDRADWSGKNG